MLLNIRHLTSYSYDHPVILGAHCLRLTPRADCYGSLLERTLKITPEPSKMSMSVENDGSISHWVQFDGRTKIFTVESKLLISLITDKNPFDFLIYPDNCISLPMHYPPKSIRELQTFLMVDDVAARSVRNFAFEVLTQAKNRTMDFLVMLSKRIKADFVYEFRHAGAAHPPEYTLSTGRGSCRDFVILYMAAASSMGLATRFVSGYYFDENPHVPDLHAWVEVYIPGGGWRGFDPSLGLACYGHHIALATSASAAGTAPIQGSFKGNAQAEMKLELEYQYSSMMS
jgi:transglutaminase-like putative cysteine protease